MSGRYFYDDESAAVDRADLKIEAAAERKAANAYCLECECRGYHATGCPETPEAATNDDEEDGK